MSDLSKLDILKQKIKKNLVIYSLSISLIISLYIYSSTAIDNLIQSKEMIKSEINGLNSRITELTIKIREINEARKFWEKLNFKNISRSGLQIDQLKLLIDKLQKNYNLIDNVDIDMSAPTEVDSLKSKTTSVISSTVKLKFKAYTDESLFQFIETLFNDLSGFKNLKSLDMKKSPELNGDLLKKISSGEHIPIVEGEMVFDWMDFKDALNDNKTGS